MSLDNIGLFRGFSEKMNWLSQRQEVISQNVANADTPHYRPQDIQAFDFKKALRGHGNLAQPVSGESSAASGAVKTNVAHISMKSLDQAEAKERDQKRVYEVAPDGNSVILEEQMMRSTETAAEYQTMVNMYKKHFDMIMTALGRNG